MRARVEKVDVLGWNKSGFKMALFGNSEPEEFLLFVGNFNMTLEGSGTLVAGKKIQYLRMLVRIGELHKLDMFSA